MPACNHVFVYYEERESPSALGTHRARCQHCHLNYFAFVAKEVSRRVTVGTYDEKTFHIHCWDSDLPEWKCGNKTWNGEPCNAHRPILDR